MFDIQEKLKEIGPYVPESDDDLLVTTTFLSAGVRK